MTSLASTIDWEKVVRVSSAFLTPVIALVTAYIAWQQHKTNKNGFRLALFERRLKVFNSATELIFKTIEDADIQIPDLKQFLWDSRESEFLFGADIAGYLKELYDRAANLHVLSAANNPETAAAQTQVLHWFSGQGDEAKKRFGKYMAFKESD